MNQTGRDNLPKGEFTGPLSSGSFRSLERPGVAWVVLGLCLVVTLVSWHISLLQLEQRGRDRFQLRIEQVKQAIQLRMQAYQQVLKGTKGLFAASEQVKREEWREYFESLDINSLYPGIRALGYIAQVAPQDLAAFVATNRLDGQTDFRIHPPPAATVTVHYVVQFVQPQAGNSSVLGYDLATEPRRREAAEAARDSGEATLTSLIHLVQHPDKAPAVLLLLPIYRNGASRDTVEQRRASIQGWVYGAFVMQDLMAGLLEAQNPDIDFEIFDGNRPTRANLLYDADGIPHAFETEKGPFNTSAAPITLGGRQWSLNFYARPAFHAAKDYTETNLLLFGGIAISFLLFAITRSLASTRQRALVLARQMSEKFRLQERAVISSNNGIFITDASEAGNPIIHANPALERITGYSAEEIVGSRLSFLMGDDLDQPDFKKLERAMAEGAECRVVLRSCRRDGTVFWNELSVSPVRDETGIVNYFVGITEDITERKRAEEALRATSALQRAILESADYAVISTTSDGRVSIFNAAAERMTGYRAEEIVGRATPLIWHDRGEMEARASQLTVELGRTIEPGFEVFIAKSRLGRPDENEWTFVRKDGSRLPVLLSVTSVRDEQGKILGFMGIASDIAERKRAEARLQQATQAATAASRAKSEFLANMSHEIRTPMNAVIGMTNLALSTELNREQRGYLAAVKNSAEDLLTIIDDVLDFSKIEAGRLELNPEPFALRETLVAALKMFSLRAADKGLELGLRVDPAVPDDLVGDAARLRQILNNLVGNALKFTDRGEVTIEVARVAQPGGQSGGSRMNNPDARSERLHFIVADSGIGFPPDKQKAIFDAFTQADTSITRRHGGAGLGLAICHKLCQLMGGEIWAESEPGRGSRFHFTVAFATASPDATSPALSAFGDLAGKSALVVDDHPVTRRNLCEMLASWRMQPVAAADVEEALLALRHLESSNHPPSVVLMDASLPEGQPAKLVAELAHTGGRTPHIILLLSSFKTPRQLQRWREQGVHSFLVKPVGASELLDAILQQSPVEANGAAAPELHRWKQQRSLRVLLAEDNSVNRELAATILQKLGHSVVTVWNGQEAVNTWKAGGVDLILMDVQMPIMDGFEATGLIRRAEQGTGRHVPIIGLTAHAMKGDREDGLAAGMDEYLTKPLKLEELIAALEKLQPSETGTRPDFDGTQLLKALNGDAAASRRMAQLFLETTPPLLEKIRDASRRGDARALFQAAHTLRGSLAQVGDPDALAVVTELERRARASDLEGTTGLIAQLEGRMSQLDYALTQWLAGPVPAG